MQWFVCSFLHAAQWRHAKARCRRRTLLWRQQVGRRCAPSINQRLRYRLIPDPKFDARPNVRSSRVVLFIRWTMTRNSASSTTTFQPITRRNLLGVRLLTVSMLRVHAAISRSWSIKFSSCKVYNASKCWANILWAIISFHIISFHFVWFIEPCSSCFKNSLHVKRYKKGMISNKMSRPTMAAALTDVNVHSDKQHKTWEDTKLTKMRNI